MHFDIAEAIRQKQQRQPRIVGVENGKAVVTTTSDGTLVVRLENRPGAGDRPMMDAFGKHDETADGHVLVD